MNIYDFDNTIIDIDTSNRFFWYSLKRRFFLVFPCIFKALKECIKKIFKKSNLGLIKSELYSYVKNIKDFDKFMGGFKKKYIKRIKEFYIAGKKDNDVIISASFEFLIEPFCKELGIKNIIATKYDIKNGRIIGNNCKGEEKVKRFKELYGKKKVEEAYSDSYSDIPMLMLAKKAYLVNGERLILLDLNR